MPQAPGYCCEQCLEELSLCALRERTKLRRKCGGESNVGVQAEHTEALCTRLLAYKVNATFAQLSRAGLWTALEQSVGNQCTQPCVTEECEAAAFTHFDFSLCDEDPGWEYDNREPALEDCAVGMGIRT